jgi:hypothetical protein
MPLPPKDLMAPRTGGFTPKGDPERAEMLSNIKDVYGYLLNPYGPGQEAIAKQSGFAAAVEDVATGKDYRSLPISQPDDARDVPGQSGSVAESLAGTLADHFVPLVFGKKRIGSNISNPERFFGIRPASPYLTNREAVKRSKANTDNFQWRRKVQLDQKEKSQEEP